MFEKTFALPANPSAFLASLPREEGSRIYVHGTLKATRDSSGPIGSYEAHIVDGCPNVQCQPYLQGGFPTGGQFVDKGAIDALAQSPLLRPYLICCNGAYTGSALDLVAACLADNYQPCSLRLEVSLADPYLKGVDVRFTREGLEVECDDDIAGQPFAVKVLKYFERECASLVPV